MNLLKKSLVLLVAIEHIYFLILEMFLWQTPTGLKTFDMTAEKAEITSVLAANQGLYNGFLAAGLFWALIQSQPQQFKKLATFFLLCVLLAGIYGGMTAGIPILFIQGGPALLALLAVAFLPSKYY